MKVYALRNDDGEYISMDACNTTIDWFKASKFPFDDIGKRMRYIDSSFKLVEFEVIETYIYSDKYE